MCVNFRSPSTALRVRIRIVAHIPRCPHVLLYLLHQLLLLLRRVKLLGRGSSRCRCRGSTSVVGYTRGWLWLLLLMLQRWWLLWLNPSNRLLLLLLLRDACIRQGGRCGRRLLGVLLLN